MAELVDIYGDLPLGTTYASVVAIAERLKLTEVATLDRRHSTVVRPTHVDTLNVAAIAAHVPGPVTGLLIVRQIEHQAGQWARNYMRDLREGGQSWQRISETIGWEDNAAACAFAAATASPWLDTETRQWRDDKTFGWHCSGCGKQVVDHGPGADAEHGHAEECSRHATT